MNKGYTTILVILIVVVALLTLTIYSLNSEKTITNKVIYEPTWNQETLNSIEINEEVISYTMSKFDVQELRNIPFTKNTPKIEVAVEGENFVVEVVKGKIFTSSGETNEEDIKISTTRDDLIEIINESNDAVEEIKDAINEGTTEVEITAGNAELLAKGYLSTYDKFTS